MSRKKFTKDFVLSQLKAILGYTCTFDKVEYVDSHTPIIITCKEHGDFSVRPCDVFYRDSGCPECSKKKISKSKALTTQQFIKKAKLKTDCENIDFTLTNYINNKTPCLFICKKHGVFQMKPYYFLLGHGCPECAKLS